MENQAVFEEWDTYAKKKKLLHRQIDLDSIIRNSKSKIIAVTGIRRSGKSSILMLLAQRLSSEGKKAAYINLEDSRLGGNNNQLDDVLKWFGDNGYLLLDEVTSASGWEGWLSRVHELLKGKLMIIVSSSRKTIAMPHKALRGRILIYEVFPLSFVEFLEFKNIETENTVVGRGKLEKALEEYLKYGGFPEIALTKDHTDKIKIINSYFKDIVGLDIAEISKQDLSTIELFSRYILQASYFSASKCLSFLKTLGYKIGKEKILELEKYSEISYLFFFIPIFSNKIKDRLQYPRKAYVGDIGFYYGMSGKIDVGKAYENLVFLELKRRLRETTEIYYWKNTSGYEVDFLIRNGTDTTEALQVAYEIKQAPTKNRELRALIECNKELKPSTSTVITKDSARTEVIDGVEIRYISILDWILKNKNKEK